MNQGFNESRIQGIKDSRNQGFNESRIQRIKDSRNQGFKESRIQGIKDSRIQALNFIQRHKRSYETSYYSGSKCHIIHLLRLCINPCPFLFTSFALTHPPPPLSFSFTNLSSPVRKLGGGREG